MKADNADQEERRIQRRLEEKRRILEMQRWRRKKRRKKRKEGKSLLNDCKFSKTKLSKLVLTTFDGIHFDWFKFWNQFEIQIDKCDLPQVSKFSYLKELVIPKVRVLIYSFHFTSEDYTWSKNILMTKYEKPSEVANAHVQNIVLLPQINNSNPQNFHEFSEKLLCSVQALDTMGKIKEMNEYARIILDKLQGIRADLVRNDDHWQDWKISAISRGLKEVNYERSYTTE